MKDFGQWFHETTGAVADETAQTHATRLIDIAENALVRTETNRRKTSPGAILQTCGIHRLTSPPELKNDLLTSGTSLMAWHVRPGAAFSADVPLCTLIRHRRGGLSRRAPPMRELSAQQCGVLLRQETPAGHPVKPKQLLGYWIEQDAWQRFTGLLDAHATAITTWRQSASLAPAIAAETARYHAELDRLQKATQEAVAAVTKLQQEVPALRRELVSARMDAARRQAHQAQQMQLAAVGTETWLHEAPLAALLDQILDAADAVSRWYKADHTKAEVLRKHLENMAENLSTLPYREVLALIDEWERVADFGKRFADGIAAIAALHDDPTQTDATRAEQIRAQRHVLQKFVNGAFHKTPSTPEHS
jgi:hypothetical protein